MRRADKIKDWKKQLNDKSVAREDMLARLEQRPNTYHVPDMRAYQNYSTNTKKEYAPPEPSLQDQVHMLVGEVAKLTVLVDRQETDLKAYEEEKSEWWKLVEALKYKVDKLEQDLDVQIDGVHSEIRELWEELEE